MLHTKMTFNIDDLSLLYPDRVILEFSGEEQELLWRQSQNKTYQTASQRWQSYLNHLSRKVFSEYISEEVYLSDKPSSFPEENLSQWVNGSAIKLGKTRLVIIPNDETDLTELRIPREWFELEDWAGNYYLSIQLDLENNYLQVLGFISHQQLQKEGIYDPLDQTYVLETDTLIEDLNVMWLDREFQPSPILSVKNRGDFTINETEAQNILEQITTGQFLIPRLEIPFSQWGGLLSQQKWRRSLIISEKPTLTHLKQWLQKGLDQGWQTLDQLLTPQSMNLALSFRKGTERGINIEGVKLIDLGLQLGNQSVALLLGLSQLENNKVEVRVQLLPISKQSYLPAEIELSLLSSSEKVLQTVQAREGDQLIQLKRFTCTMGKSFKIKMCFREFCWMETFVMQ